MRRAQGVERRRRLTIDVIRRCPVFPVVEGFGHVLHLA
jgi:hypothetical protein